VSLNGTLNTAFLVAPGQGTSLTLISNDASDAVSGAFAGLPQGAGFAISGVPLRIQYNKGTGNDVTLFVARPPTDIQLSSAIIPENSPNGTIVGTLLAVDDPDGGDVFTFELTDDAGGRFSLNGDQLIVSNSTLLNFESANSHAVSVTVKDADGFTFDQQLTISVTNVNEAPTDLGITNNSVAEELPAGATVGSLLGVDPDSGSVFSYSLVSGTGDVDNAQFAVVGAALVTAQKLDFETKPVCSVRIRCTDAGALFFEKAFSINVLNGKDPASISLSGLDVVYDGLPKTVTASTQPAGLTVAITYNGSATPPVNAGSYSISAVINDSNFTGSATGQLTIAKALPFITWNFPSDILVGTPLSGAQLNASTNIPGTFSYEPGAGTVLPEGAGQTLKVTFTPSDSANFAPSVATVVINVVPLSGGGGGAPAKLDSDGDGVSDALEEAAGTDPLNPSSSPAAGPPQPLTADKLSIKLNFGKPANDSIQLSGVLPVPAGLAVAGQKVGIGVGGVARFFTLDAKGGATPRTNDSISLKVKAKKGVVAAQSSKFSVKYGKGAFSAGLKDSGLVNDSVKDKAVSLRIEVLFNGTLYEKIQPVLYSAIKGKSGKTKQPK
jgi:VCBS repeat-containing protein